MIDLHSHILPDVDDGSDSLEESIRMAEMAAESGTRYLVATPHSIPGMYDNYKSKYLSEVFLTLRKEIQRAEIPLALVYGMEHFCTEMLPDQFRRGKAWTLNGSRYYLVEMAFDEDPYFFESILEEVEELGYHPIIAHPERYYSVQDDIRIAERWFERGWGLQINRGSVQGRFGRREMLASRILLENGCCTCIASDAHSSTRRTPELAETRQMIAELYGNPMAKLLFRDNPRRILADKPLISPIDL